MVRAVKYLSPVVVYILAYCAFTFTGWMTTVALLYAWILLPAAELILPVDQKNLDQAEAEIAKQDKTYDYLLYLFVILQYGAVIYFLFSMKTIPQLHTWEIAMRIGTMGLLCGSFGINIGHELGHRVNKFEQTLASAALLTSLYMHFKIEHNKGHHFRVATPDDPASAQLNEPVYLFYFRTIIFSYLSAWKIANAEMRKNNLPLFNLKNKMLQAHIIQIVFVGCIALFFGWMITLCFAAAAFIGIILLETVNYIEHYGLQRKQTTSGRYERAMPEHSWNSNHILGRLMLFELSRHSDHHFMASKKYQLLHHHENSPQLPTGYPGSMILALFPPLWFRIMNERIKELNTHNG